MRRLSYLLVTAWIVLFAVQAQAVPVFNCKNDSAQGLINLSVWKVNLPNPTKTNANEGIWVAVSSGGSTATWTVTDDKSNTWTNATKVSDGSNNNSLNISYAVGVASGTQLLTITFDAPHRYIQVMACEVSGVATSTPLDAESGRTTSTGTIATAAFTTATNGDLIINVAGIDGFSTQTTPMTWTAGLIGGSTATIALYGNDSYMATQYITQTTAGSTTASITSSINASGAMTKAIALKAAGTPSTISGIYVQNISVQSLENDTSYATYSPGTSFTFQHQVVGNLFALAWTGRPNNKVTTVTSSPSMTWTSCAASSDSGGSGNSTWWWYAVNVTPGIYSVTVTFATTPAASVQNFVDVSGAAITQTTTCAGTSGSDTSIASGGTGSIPGPTITPLTSTGVVLTVAQEDRHTAVNISPGSFQATDVGVYASSSGDTDEGLGVHYPSSTSPISYTWTYNGYEGGAGGPGAYCSQSISFDAGSAGGVCKRSLLGVGC